MKRIVVFVCVAFILVNVLFGAILSSYEGFNVLLSSAMIVFNGALLVVSDMIHIRDGFKVSFAILSPLVGALEFILSLFFPCRIEDNWMALALLILILLQILVLFIVNVISNKIK